ncbi:MAG: FecR domain-containing protein [Sphingomonadales bacterium]|nr:FecR domain-containing protein [Sphingomonadales bacterium]
MTNLRSGLAALALVALVLPGAGNARANAPTATHSSGEVSYVMKRGDTLFVLWRQFFAGPKALNRVRSMNRITNVRRIPTGKVLHIPRTLLLDQKSLARLESLRGQVTISVNGATRPAREGETLSEGAEVETGRNAFVTLRLADGSTLAVPSLSVLGLTWLREVNLTGALEREVNVRAGRMRARVTPMTNPDSSFRVVTPVAVSAVRGTEFRVAYRAGQSFSAVEVDNGKVEFIGADTRVLISAGFGAVNLNGQQSGALRLLAPPKLDEPDKVQSEEQLHFSLIALAGAESYHVQIARDAGFVENVAEETSQGTEFTMQSLPADSYFVKVSAYDEQGLEGMADTYTFERRRNIISGTIEVGSDKRQLRFRWDNTSDGLASYRFQLVRKSEPSLTVVDETGLNEKFLSVSNVSPGDYAWRVGSQLIANGKVIMTWTEPQTFHVTK